MTSPRASSYELHGRWIPDRGLMLWIRDCAGGESPGRVADLPVGAFPPIISDLIQRVPVFRYTLPFTVLGEGGYPRSRTVPCLVISAGAALAFLTECATSATPIPGLGEDLRFLAHAVAGVTRWVDAGRVAPRLYHHGPTWYAHWQLLGGGAQRVWLTELLHALPPVLAHNGGFAAVESFVEAMAAELCRQRLRDLPHRPRQALVEALITGEPFIEGTLGFSERLRQWQNGAADTDTEVVLRLHEPLPDTPEWWGLEVSVRVLGSAPEPLIPSVLDAASYTTATKLWARATEAYPALLESVVAGYGEDRLLTTVQATDFVTRGVNVVRAQGIVVMLPRAWVAAPVSMRLQVIPGEGEQAARSAATGAKVGLDAIIDYQWQVALGDVVLTPAELFDIVQEQSGLVHLRDGWVQADPILLRRAAEFIAAKSGKRRRKVLSQADLAATQEGTAGDVLQELISADTPVPVTGTAGSTLVDDLLAHRSEPVHVSTDDLVAAQLRPYQQRGVDWIASLDALGQGGILADDMGLGKTLQVLTVLAYDKARGAVPADSAVLVVCPMSLAANWYHEAQKFAPQLAVAIHHGADRSSGSAFQDVVAQHDVIITTYNLLHRDRAELMAVTWWRVVFDEAQHLKNVATQQSRAARALSAAHRLALTGTPMENNLEEFRALMDLVNPGYLGTQHGFRHHYALPIERDHDDTLAAQLRTLTAPFLLRRLKSDPAVISDLPDKNEMVVHASLTPEQAGLYHAVVDDMLEKINQAKGLQRKGAVLAALTKLKQVCNHPAHYFGDGSAVLRHGQHRSGKVALLEELLSTILAEGEKALIFTQYKEFGDYLANYLHQRFNVAVPFLHGSLRREERDAMVESFQSAEGAPLMVLSLKAGGTGLTLTAANHVIHCDRWWNPAVENQATDRAYRIGQTKDVQVRKLVCDGTIEERIDDIIAHKSTMSDLVVGTGETWLTELDDDQLQELFRLEVK